MNNLLFLKQKRSPLTDKLNSIIHGFRLDNAFNPCYIQFQKKSYITIRAKSADKHTFHFDALLIEVDPAKDSINISNLSAHFRELGIENIADPKLFRLKDTIWVTFNTGWSSTENQIYICKIAPSLENPLLCKYDDRSKVEKNWAFFEYNGKLHALYSLSPIRFLRAEHKKDDDYIHFIPSESIPTASYPEEMNLSIGTQICKNGDTNYLIAHKKISLFGKRAYFGVPIRFKINNGLPKFEKSRSYLSHSPMALLGSSTKHNKNLFSCTYFSGLHIQADVAILSYGINDTQSNFSSIKLEQIW